MGDSVSLGMTKFVRQLLDIGDLLVIINCAIVSYLFIKTIPLSLILLSPIVISCS